MDAESPAGTMPNLRQAESFSSFPGSSSSATASLSPTATSLPTVAIPSSLPPSQQNSTLHSRRQSAFQQSQESQQQNQAQRIADDHHPGLQPSPPYRRLHTVIEKKDNGPGPRCGHTLTAIAAVGEKGTPGYVGGRLILFGGATVIEDRPVAAGMPAGSAGVRLARATADIHCYDVTSNRWTRLNPVGEPPSPRAAHTATAVGLMIVIQGGIGPSGLSDEDLHVLDLTHPVPRWKKVVIHGPGPGQRFGHAMAFVGQRFLIEVGGRDGRGELSDVWALDIVSKSALEWRRLRPEGEGPPPCMYATACVRRDGLLLLCGGRDAANMPIAHAYGLTKHSDERWEWAIIAGISPSPRFQHSAAFVNARLHVLGGALGGDKTGEESSSVAVLDTVAGIWLDQKGIVTSPRAGRCTKDDAGGNASVELTRRCRHAAASVGDLIFIYGGLRGDVLLDDLLMCEDAAAVETTNAALHAASLNSPSANGQSVTQAVNARFLSHQRGGRNVESWIEASTTDAEAIIAALTAETAIQPLER